MCSPIRAPLCHLVSLHVETLALQPQLSRAEVRDGGFLRGCLEARSRNCVRSNGDPFPGRWIQAWRREECRDHPSAHGPPQNAFGMQKQAPGPSVVEASAGQAQCGRADMIYHVVSAHAGPRLTRVLFT